MLQKIKHPLVSVSIVAAILLSLGLTARNSLAGKGKVDPHKVVILCTGDDRGQAKAACT